MKKDSSPFHGYYFQIATEQTADAATGSNAYISPAKKSAQAVLAAFPDEYRGSGVMTFVVTQDGAVYQKDLGTDTARLGPAVLKGHITRSAWEAVNEDGNARRASNLSMLPPVYSIGNGIGGVYRGTAVIQ